MNKIAENNKLIAEFMGWKKTERGVYNNVEVYNGEQLYGNWTHSSNMEFHSSWDWLMPVVEKIDNIVADENGRTFIEKINTIVADENGGTFIERITTNGKKSKLDATYKAVVKFIKWYNNETNN